MGKTTIGLSRSLSRYFCANVSGARENVTDRGHALPVDGHGVGHWAWRSMIGKVRKNEMRKVDWL